MNEIFGKIHAVAVTSALSWRWYCEKKG